MNRKIIFSWGLVLFWASLIFFLSAMPHDPTESSALEFFARKCAHVAEYAVFFLLVRHALETTWPALPLKKLIWLGLLISFLYASSDEFHQRFVAGRVGTTRDVLVDMLGAFGAGFLWYDHHKKKAKPFKETATDL